MVVAQKLHDDRALRLLEFTAPVLADTPLIGHRECFALLVALTLAVATAAAGVAGNDPYDGALRGLFEAGGCLVGFAVLGRYLGLRASS